MWRQRQYDPRPAPTEVLREWIDRTICGQPALRLWREWGWPDPSAPAFDLRFVEVSRPIGQVGLDGRITYVIE